MKKHFYNKTLAAILTAVLMAVPVYAQEGGLSLFDGMGKEKNQITTSQAMMQDTQDLVALDDLGISVVADVYTAIRQEDGFVYIYTQNDGSMPYVIIGRYEIVSEDFADAFTAYMAGSYSDLRVVQDAYPVSIAGKSFTKIVYEYTAGGYTVQDTRLFSAAGNFTYMFGAKEVPSLVYYVGDGYLDRVAGSCDMLAGGESDYEKHVDSTRSVEGSSTSVAVLGGFGNDVILSGAGSDDTEDAEDAQGAGDVEDAEDTQDTETAPSDEPAGSGGIAIGTGVGDTGSVVGSGTTSKASNEIIFDESYAGYDGVWVPFDDGFKLYLPSNWNTYSVPEEMKANGCFYEAGDATAQTNATAPYIAVNYGETQGITTLDEIAEGLSQAGYTVDETVLVNGMECVSYGMPSQDLEGLIFFYPYSKDYMFAVVCYNYSYNVDLESAILCSLSPNM